MYYALLKIQLPPLHYNTLPMNKLIMTFRTCRVFYQSKHAIFHMNSSHVF
jgi:hypothetical protein